MNEEQTPEGTAPNNPGFEKENLESAKHIPVDPMAGQVMQAEVVSSAPSEGLSKRGREKRKIVPVKLTTPGDKKKAKFKRTWKAIDRTSFTFLEYQQFIEGLITPGSDTYIDLGNSSLLFNTQAYTILKFATEEFVRRRLSGIPTSDRPLPNASIPNVLPYYEQVLRQLDAFPFNGPQRHPSMQPKVQANRAELIWSYWMEEGMLVQTMNAIALRFQNISVTRFDPLANFELDSLRPLSNVLFGYIQDTHNRLTITRRNHEYMYEYGIRLFGDAVPNGKSVAVRTSFIEAFHTLLYQCIEFYKLIDDLTKNADAYPLLNTLQEVNLLLMQGMHNQYNDLSLKARSEMLLEQWILSRREINEFLHGKPMVIYDEPWMSAVDTMKDIQGWPSLSIRAYHELAVHGEDILLSIRYSQWNTTFATTADVKAWALENRESIQRYIHNYKTVTGVDIAEPPTSGRAELKGIMPGVLIQQRFQKDRLLKRG